MAEEKSPPGNARLFFLIKPIKTPVIKTVSFWHTNTNSDHDVKINPKKSQEGFYDHSIRKQFSHLRHDRLVHGNHFYKHTLSLRQKPKAYREHIYLDVPDLWYGKPFKARLHAFKKAQSVVSRKRLHGLYLHGRISDRFFP